MYMYPESKSFAMASLAQTRVRLNTIVALLLTSSRCIGVYDVCECVCVYVCVRACVLASVHCMALTFPRSVIFEVPTLTRKLRLFSNQPTRNSYTIHQKKQS